jgi:hypothetical protein
MSDFKPGDVAMVQVRDGDWRLALHHVNKYEDSDGPFWRFENGALRPVSESTARPVVVIDPTDRAAMKRLAEAYIAVSLRNDSITDRLTRALTEYANPTPPKPEEPLGLGAVVVDDEGVAWVLADDDNQPWRRSNGCWRAWADIPVTDASQIKSPGVDLP